MKSRREFLGAAALTPLPLAAASRPAARIIGANDRIQVGVIGLGTMGYGHVRRIHPYGQKTGSVQITAASDIYTKRRERTRDFLGLQDQDLHHEYRDLLARNDVDAVFIATPDHWHFRMAMDAVAAGKDVFLQKPMTLTVDEARTLAAAVKRSRRVMQIGSQYASEPQYLVAREAVREGRIGQVLWAQGTYCRNTFHGEWNYKIDPEGTPENIDWKRFLGSAPKRPFSQDRYFRWRKYWDYSGGIATDLLYHRLVPFLTVLGPQFPVRVSANGGIWVHKDREVPDTISTTIEYPDFQVIMSSSMAADIPGQHLRPMIYGHEGTIEFKGKEVLLTPEPIWAKAKGRQPIRLTAETGDLQDLHMINFFDCMRSRLEPNLGPEFGYQVMVAIGLGVDAYRESRQIAFDPRTQRILRAAPPRPGYEGHGRNVDEAQPPA
ncbi:MAG: Gfo/Idh/MocA family oxidoreductase [Bryobacterales bacterium]|nr:Gfo/Idh/MocA family oxidoreductase [Bryobacterales bacterium]